MSEIEENLKEPIEKLKKRRKIMKEVAFKGVGVMKFDDYNYGAVNDVVFNMNNGGEAIESPLA